MHRNAIERWSTLVSHRVDLILIKKQKWNRLVVHKLRIFHTWHKFGRTNSDCRFRTTLLMLKMSFR